MSIERVADKTFEDITGHELNTSSILNLFNILSDDGEYFLNIFKPYSVNQQIITDILYYDTYETDDIDWFDYISFKIYATPQLWWVVCLTNDILNPFEELEPGKNLKVLKQSLVPIIIRETKEMAEK